MNLAFAIPQCPSYPYHDYTAASAYSPPVKPDDTLLHYCDWSLNPICLLSNAFNTTEDKKLFIAESIANDSFSQIVQWNQGIRFGKYPPDTSKSSTNIKDAWVSIAYLDPSVYDNGTYRINTTTKPLIRQSFTFVVDTSPLPGDCDDNFRICGYDYSVSVQNTSSNVSAVMNVWSEYLVDRYEWITHCDLTGCWVTCDYYTTQSFKDAITVSDSKKTNYTAFKPTSNYTILAHYNGLAELSINANDSSVFFQMGNSSFYKADYVYMIRNEAGPYNVLVKELIPANKTSTYGLSILARNGSVFHILAPYSPVCFLRAADHFNSNITRGCNISNATTPSIKKIEVPKPSFFDKLLGAALLALVIYILYLIVKKVMYRA